VSWHREEHRLLSFLMNMGSRYAGIGLSVVLGLIVLPFNLRYLGASEYGLLVLVASITTYFSVLELGYGSATVKYVAEYRAKRDADALNQIVSTTFFLFAGLGLLSYAVAIGVALLLPHIFSLTPAQVHTGRIVLLIIAGNVAIHFAFSVFGAVVNGFERNYRNASYGIVSEAAAALGNLSVLLLGGGLVHVVAVTTVIRMTPYWFYRRNAHQVFPELRIRWASVQRERLRELTGFSAYLAVMDWSARLTYAFDAIILGALLNTGAVAVYSVGQKMSDGLSRLTQQLHTVLFPALVHRSVMSSIDAQRQLMVRAARLQLAVAIALCGSVAATAPSLIRAWVGPGFETSVPIAQLLAVLVVMRTSMAMPATVLKATGHHRFAAAAMAGCAVASVLLSTMLVNSFGLIGIAWGPAVCVLVLTVGFIYPRACRALELPVLSAYRQIVWPALWPVLPAVAVLRLTTPLLPPRLMFLLPQLAFGTLVYAAGFLLWGLDREERQWMWTKVRTLRRKPPQEFAAAVGTNA
jgi:O-antigen/teichoic acid export membrane protein